MANVGTGATVTRLSRAGRGERVRPRQLWHLEVRNALVSAERRGRITARGLSDRLRALRRLPVTTDAAPDLDAVVALARSHRLSIYDAVYLELARRHRAALATLDAGLAHAAAAEDLPIVE